MNTQFNSNVIWLQLEYKISTLRALLNWFMGRATCIVHLISVKTNQHGINCTKAKEQIRYYCINIQFFFHIRKRQLSLWDAPLSFLKSSCSQNCSLFLRYSIASEVVFLIVLCTRSWEISRRGVSCFASFFRQALSWESRSEVLVGRSIDIAICISSAAKNMGYYSKVLSISSGSLF